MSFGKTCLILSKMQLGKTYYISVFIGNLDPNTGNVNFTDRCALFDVVPVTWYIQRPLTIFHPAPGIIMAGLVQET